MAHPDRLGRAVPDDTICEVAEGTHHMARRRSGPSGPFKSTRAMDPSQRFVHFPHTTTGARRYARETVDGRNAAR